MSYTSFFCFLFSASRLCFACFPPLLPTSFTRSALLQTLKQLRVVGNNVVVSSRRRARRRARRRDERRRARRPEVLSLECLTNLLDHVHEWRTRTSPSLALMELAGAWFSCVS